MCSSQHKHIILIFSYRNWVQNASTRHWKLNFYCFREFTLFCPPPHPSLTGDTDAASARICGYERVQSHAALTPSYLIVSMRISGVRYPISHHLARWASVSRISWVRVILLMLLLLLLSSFSSSSTYCTLFKFHTFNEEECLKEKEKGGAGGEISPKIIIDEHQNFPNMSVLSYTESGMSNTWY